MSIDDSGQKTLLTVARDAIGHGLVQAEAPEVAVAEYPAPLRSIACTFVTLHKDAALTDFDGDVADSGEGRWTVKTAVDLGVPAHVLSSALYNRFSSRGEATYANKVLSALRYAFGGHVEKS